MSKSKVLLAVPNGDGWIHKITHMTVIRLIGDGRAHTTHICPTHRPYENNLHLIQKDFLAGDYTHWVHIDDDNPPVRNIYDLLELDLDIIGFPTPIWFNKVQGDRPFYYNALYEVDGGYKPIDTLPGFKASGLYEVDAVGSGCMMIARRVLEKLKAPFLRTYSEDGIVEISGDYSFCKRAKAAGFRVWTHFDYPCMHFKEIELSEVIRAFADMR